MKKLPGGRALLFAFVVSSVSLFATLTGAVILGKQSRRGESENVCVAVLRKRDGGSNRKWGGGDRDITSNWAISKSGEFAFFIAPVNLGGRAATQHHRRRAGRE